MAILVDLGVKQQNRQTKNCKFSTYCGGHLRCTPYMVLITLISGVINMPKHEYLHGNYFCHIRAAILNAILNLLICSVVTRCHPLAP